MYSIFYFCIFWLINYLLTQTKTKKVAANWISTNNYLKNNNSQIWILHQSWRWSHALVFFYFTIKTLFNTLLRQMNTDMIDVIMLPQRILFSPRIAPPQQAVPHRSVASEEAKERRPHTHLRPWAVNRERQPHMRQTQTAAPSKSAGTPAVRDQTCLCVCVWLSGRAASRVKSRTAAVKRLSDGAERAQRSSLGGAAVGVSGGVPRQRSGFADASPTHKTVTLTPRIHFAHSCETLPSVNPKLGPHSRHLRATLKISREMTGGGTLRRKVFAHQVQLLLITLSHRSPRSPFMQRLGATLLELPTKRSSFKRAPKGSGRDMTRAPPTESIIHSSGSHVGIWEGALGKMRMRDGNFSFN